MHDRLQNCRRSYYHGQFRSLYRRRTGDIMVETDWFDVRGAVSWLTEQAMDYTVGMTRFWEQKYWLSDFTLLPLRWLP